MKKIAISAMMIVILPVSLLSQTVGIGTSSPDTSAVLDLKSTSKGLLIPRMTTAQRTAIAFPGIGLQVYDLTTNSTWYYNGTSWQDMNTVGGNWIINGTHQYSSNSGNVGIGTSTPASKLDVNGTIRGHSTLVIDGFVGIGVTSPNYKMTVADGSFAVFNTTDSKYWTMNYSSSFNCFQISEDGVSRMIMANGGRIGIGTTTPGYKLDVIGSQHIDSNLTVDLDITTRGKGILRNSQGAEQLKYYTRLAAFSGTLAAFSTFASDINVSIASGFFTSPPQVFICGVNGTPAASDEFYKVQVVPYDITTTGFKVKIYNNSNSSSTFSDNWVVVCIGE